MLIEIKFPKRKIMKGRVIRGLSESWRNMPWWLNFSFCFIEGISHLLKIDSTSKWDFKLTFKVIGGVFSRLYNFLNIFIYLFSKWLIILLCNRPASRFFFLRFLNFIITLWLRTNLVNSLTSQISARFCLSRNSWERQRKVTINSKWLKSKKEQYYTK